MSELRTTQIDAELDDSLKQVVPANMRGDAPKWRVDYALRRFIEQSKAEQVDALASRGRPADAGDGNAETTATIEGGSR